VDFPEVHRFNVPEGCHWRDVRETPVNVGAALSHAMREIERANPDTLYRVVRMMVELLDPKAGETIYDPACGTGGMLLGAIEHVQRAGGDARTFFGRIYGQEKNLTTASIARMNLVLHGIEDFQVVREDTLRSPAFTDSSTGGLATFDCVIANPPFSLKEWGRDLWEEGRIRQALLERDLIEAVIGLAPNIFYGTGLAPAIVVLRRNKPTGRKRRVLIADASSLFRKGRAQNFLDPEHADQIVAWVSAFRDVPDRVKVVGLDHIKTEDWTLNISRYVIPPVGEDIPPLADAVAAFKQALGEARAAEDRLREVLTEGGWLS
jgi:type I restriction enzyme M protein